MDDGDPALLRPMTAAVAPTLPHVRSRLRKGVLTYGPVGRVCWTIVMLSPPAWLIKTFLQQGMITLLANAFSIVFVVVWTGWIAPRALRDIWAKETVYVPQPVLPPVKLLTDHTGARVVSLEEYVAGQAPTDTAYLR